jgi:lysyl-tRNA synthetase class 2
MSIPFLEENDQTIARGEHLAALRELVGNAYPNKFERSDIVEPGREDTITAIVEKFRDFEPKEELNKFVVRLAGRMATPPRVMGKAAFVHLSDGVSRLQIYVRKADVVGVRNDAEGGEADGWAMFQLLDHGDFIGVEG